MRRLILFVLGLAAALVLMPTTAVADSATHTYTLLMEGPNFGVAPDGDQIAITGEADFSVNPKSVEGGDRSRTQIAAGPSSQPGPGRRPACSTTSRTAAGSCTSPGTAT